MYSVFEVANYILYKAKKEDDLISNLKLQKLVYYSQGVYLAIHEEPLFSEIIEKWSHGPVIPDLYHKYKKFQSKAIPSPKKYDENLLDEECRELLDEVYNIYGRFSASALRNMSHNEPPWIKTEESQEISLESLQKYFKKKLKIVKKNNNP